VVALKEYKCHLIKHECKVPVPGIEEEKSQGVGEHEKCFQGGGEVEEKKRIKEM
jgi:hypothetical protein